MAVVMVSSKSQPVKNQFSIWSFIEKLSLYNLDFVSPFGLNLHPGKYFSTFFKLLKNRSADVLLKPVEK